MDALPLVPSYASRALRIGWHWALGATFLAIAPPALSANEPVRWENVTLAVEGNSPCASEAELFRHLERLVPGIRRASPGQPSRRARVEMATGADGSVTGRLWTSNTPGPETMRELPASTCDEALEALAFVIAVTLLPDAPHAPESRQPLPLPPQLPTGPPQPQPPRPEPPQPQPPRPEPSQSQRPDPSPAAQVPLPPSREGVRWGLQFAVRATAMTGVAPSVLVGVLGAVGLVPHTARAWVPSFELGVERSLPKRDTLVVEGASMQLETGMWLVRGGVCAGRWRRGAFVVNPCIDLAAGRLEAEATGTEIVRPGGLASGWWMAAGVRARGSLRLGSGFYVDLGVGVRVPFRRYDFDFSRPSDETGATPPEPVSSFRTSELMAIGEAGIVWMHE